MLRIARGFAACCVAGLAACAPMRVKQQPDVVFHIETAGGAPLPGAVLHFERYSVRPASHGAPMIETIEPADATGDVHLHERVEWQAALLPQDAETGDVFRWEWCVEKPGFAPAIGELAFDAEVPPRITVVLRADDRGGRCPDATSSGYKAGP